MFKSLWDAMLGVIDVGKAIMSASVVGTMTVASGLVMAIFWGYAAYKIIELFATYRGDGGGSVIWTVWEKARRPMVVYVLMFIGPIFCSTITGMAVSRANNGLSTMKTAVGASLGRVDGFFGGDLSVMSKNLSTSAFTIITSGRVGATEESVHSILTEMDKLKSEDADLATSLRSKGVKAEDIPAKIAEKAKQSQGAVMVGEKALLAANARLQYLDVQIKNWGDPVNGDLANRRIIPPGSPAINDPELKRKMDEVRSKNVKKLVDEQTALKVQAASLESDLTSLKSLNATREGQVVKSENLLGFSGDGVVVEFLRKLKEECIAGFATVVGWVLMLLPIFAAAGIGIAIFKEGFQTCMYIVGFIVMCRAGNALAAPLAPLFMMTLMSDRTESYGRSFISFFLSMLFASAGLQAMTTMAGHSLVTMTNLCFALSNANVASATSIPGLLGAVVQSAAIIFSVGMAASFCMGLVKRGAALGSGILGGSFPS